MDLRTDEIEAFIERWRNSGANERANYVMFVTELCTLLDLPQPEPARDDGTTDYRFEYPVERRDDDGKASIGRIDLYKRHCFVLEAKQGTDKKLQEELPLFGLAGNGRASSATKRGTDAHKLAMQRARRQAEGYAKALPTSHGWPPFLLVVDVGHVIECFADFSLTGKNDRQFPEARSFKFRLDNLYRVIQPGNHERLGKKANSARKTRAPNSLARIRNASVSFQAAVGVWRFGASAARGRSYSDCNGNRRAPARLPE